MSESPPLPPDLPRLLTLRTWLQLQLAAVDEAISRRAQFRLVPVKPPSETATLHRADCRIEGGHLIDYDTAASAPEESYIQLCAACRPDDLLQQPPPPPAP